MKVFRFAILFSGTSLGAPETERMKERKKEKYKEKEKIRGKIQLRKRQREGERNGYLKIINEQKAKKPISG